jgi:NAD(P)-dependent dehydrogenase (short-subunit alcohol dehydrogenase family)
MKLNNHSVVITGSGSGIGRACALAFANEGANIVVADIQPESAEETVRQIHARGGTAFACQADVSRPDSVALLVDTTIKSYGKIDSLLNNAAIQVNKTIEDTSFDEWNTQMSVNVGGAFLCSKLFLPF